MTGTLHRLSAFTTSPHGGNPAGVWIGDALPDSLAMQRMATDVGYSETAFVAPASGFDRVIRYHSPAAEVAFCGHATIATGVVLGGQCGDGQYRLASAVGEIPLAVATRDGRVEASLTSVDPRHDTASDALVDGVLGALGWRRTDLDRSIWPARIYAGIWHLLLATSTLARLNELHYDFARLKALMVRDGLTTIQLVWRERSDVFHARNPFPVGGVFEDPATGSAAAALGGYLRDVALVAVPTTFVVRQGEAMGRPSLIVVDVPARGGIVVTGTAVRIGQGG